MGPVSKRDMRVAAAYLRWAGKLLEDAHTPADGLGSEPLRQGREMQYLAKKFLASLKTPASKPERP
jgi:hypothetical protein